MTHTHTHTHTPTHTHTYHCVIDTLVIVTDTPKHIDRVLCTYMTSYLPQAYRLSILIDKQALFINSWLIRLSVDNVLLINTGLSILIDKPIPLSIGISTVIPSSRYTSALRRMLWSSSNLSDHSPHTTGSYTGSVLCWVLFKAWAPRQDSQNHTSSCKWTRGHPRSRITSFCRTCRTTQLSTSSTATSTADFGLHDDAWPFRKITPAPPWKAHTRTHVSQTYPQERLSPSNTFQVIERMCECVWIMCFGDTSRGAGPWLYSCPYSKRPVTSQTNL
jgi:hypothetical protein